jgi:hypothetical protein
LVLAALSYLLLSIGSAGGRIQADSQVNIRLLPDQQTINVGSQFQIQVQVDASPERPVDTVQVYLDFDSNKLEVVGQLQAGGVLTVPLQSSSDNQLGQINYSAGAEFGAPLVTSSFLLVTINLKAKATTGIQGTNILFAPLVPPRQTKAIRGANVTGTLSTAKVIIQEVSNRPPVAMDDTARTSTNTPVTIQVLTNDIDADGDTLSVTNLTSPAHGTATLNANKTATYTPAANFNGTDTVIYTIADGKGGTDTAEIKIIVGPLVRLGDTITGAPGESPIINALDLSVLVAAFNSRSGNPDPSKPPYDALVDLDQDGDVDRDDLNVMKTNYLCYLGTSSQPVCPPPISH